MKGKSTTENVAVSLFAVGVYGFESPSFQKCIYVFSAYFDKHENPASSLSFFFFLLDTKFIICKNNKTLMKQNVP